MNNKAIEQDLERQQEKYMIVTTDRLIQKIVQADYRELQEIENAVTHYKTINDTAKGLQIISNLKTHYT